MFDTTITRPDGDGPTGKDRLYRLELWDDLPSHIECAEPVTYSDGVVVDLHDTSSFPYHTDIRIARIRDECIDDGERQTYARVTVTERYMAEWFTRRDPLFADFNELAAWLEEFLTAYRQSCQAARERLNTQIYYEG